MTNTEINMAIAEACGWTQCVPCKENGVVNWCRHPGCVCEPLLPDYANDLNAMHEAVKILMDELYDGEDGFTANLARVTQGDTAPVDGWKFRPMQEATSRQRAEAFLRTIGKWRE